MIVSNMAEPSKSQLLRANSRNVPGTHGKMSDEQLIALRGLFQAIDLNNNGSITPALLTEFYQQVRGI